MRETQLPRHKPRMGRRGFGNEVSGHFQGPARQLISSAPGRASSRTAVAVSTIPNKNGFAKQFMITVSTNRPRNVDAPRAAAILYGDWGTSKAYVIGLAFAVAGYSSFWLILAMCVLTVLVGINYIIICKQYPDGGGVYASVRHRSEVISIVGAFLLVADYLVTAAISSLSAFQYLGVPHPEQFAALAILIIGALNYFGPRHT